MLQRSTIMQKKTILIDVDDTIEMLVPEWLIAIERKFGIRVNYEDIKDWCLMKAFPTLSKEQLLSALDDEEVWKNIKPRPGAQKYVKKLIDDGHRVYLCTNTLYEHVVPKFKHVVYKYFPYIDWDHVIIIKDKQLLNADYMVDDYHKNLIGGSYHGILIDTPYNRHFDEDYLRQNRITLAATWEDVYNIISRNAA